MRRPIIIANWKMNTTLADATVLSTTVKNNIGELDVDVVLCPPFTWLYPMLETLEHKPKNLNLGAQNMWFAEKGAMTGEISPVMLKELVKYVILGHSERRSHFGETDALINDKIHAALTNKMIPVVCVGEHTKMADVEAPKRGRGRPVSTNQKADVTHQLQKALEGINRDNVEQIIVAYEPIWAIGTGNPATGAYAAGVIAKLREVVKQKYGEAVSERVRILYGGSVDSENIREFIYQPEIDGVLVGGASLKAKEFIKICREAGGRE